MTGLLFKLFFTFCKVGLFTIGGGYAMIPLIEAEVITANQWLSHAEFLDIIAIAEMTPGSVSINAATFIGYRLDGVVGALVASLGVTAPSLILLLLFSKMLLKLIQKPGAETFLMGLRSAMVSLILLAAYTLGLSAVYDLGSILIFILIFVACLLYQISPLYYIALGALMGLFLHRG